MSCCFLNFILIYLLLKKNIINYSFASHLYLINCTLTVALLSVFHSGGLFSPFLITYIMLALIAVLLHGDSGAAWLWLFLYIFIILMIGLIQHYKPGTFTISYDRSYSVFFFIACLTGVPLCTFLIAFIFEKETKYALKLYQENQQLMISNEEKDLLIREIHHRVKNNLQIISSLVNLQMNELTDKKTVDILNVTRNRIFALSLIHQKLFTGTNTGTVNFKEHIHDLLISLQNVFSAIRTSVKGPDIDIELDIATPLSLIVSELITNSFKHAFKSVQNPSIDIEINAIGNNAYRLTLKDNGRGIPEGLDLLNSPSLGMEIIKALVDQIDGTISFTSSKNGTIAIVDFTIKKIANKISF